MLTCCNKEREHTYYTAKKDCINACHHEIYRSHKDSGNFQKRNMHHDNPHTHSCLSTSSNYVVVTLLDTLGYD